MPFDRNELEKFVADSNEVLELKLIRELSDIEDDTKAMIPAMSHQVFGNNESVFGYRDLKIKLYYSAGKLITYLGMTYSEKVDPALHDVEADNVLKVVGEQLPPGFHTNLDNFCNDFPNDALFRPFGELKESFTLEECNSTYEVYYGDITTPGLNEYHEKLQTFILWYIDAASYIDTDDESWRFFFIFEKYTQSGSTRYAAVGYATVYQYYAYPANIRPRISQMLILPPFQKQGLGEKLLNCIYQHYVHNPLVKDITVEDPSDEFQRLRDFIDAKNCSQLSSFQPDELVRGFSETMENEAKKKFKLSKKQIRRVYEILRLKHTDCKDEEAYKSYRLCVKRRLNAPYKKLTRDKRKLQAVLKYVESSDEIELSPAERMAKLENDYRELEAQYRYIIDKLAAA